MSLYDDFNKKLYEKFSENENEVDLPVGDFQEELALTPSGRNSLGSYDAFVQRSKYKELYTYSEYQDKYFENPNIYVQKKPYAINFHHDLYRYYLRMDNNGNFIYPKLSKLSQIGENKYDLRALNFVSEAFLDLITYIKTQKGNKIDDESFLSGDITPKRAWANIDYYYESLIEGHFNAYLKNFLINPQEQKKVINYQSFLQSFFVDYFKTIVNDFPLTKSGLIESNQVGPNISGACIEISTDDHSDDFAKYQKFINDPHFGFYRKAAGKFGFVLDDNAPWRLVANLNSDVMREYASRYIFSYDTFGSTGPNTEDMAVQNHYHEFEVDADGNGQTKKMFSLGGSLAPAYLPMHTHKIVEGVLETISVYHEQFSMPFHSHPLKGISTKQFSTNDNFYEYFYRKSYLEDLELLKSAAENLYTKLVQTRPLAYANTICKRTTNGIYNEYVDYFEPIYTKTKILERDSTINTSKFNNLFWFKFYLMIRIAERTKKSVFNSQELKKPFNEIEKMYNYLDNSEIMEYIQEYLKVNY